MESNNENKNKECKETKWERIVKRHMSKVTVTSDAVKQLMDMDFVRANQMKIMSGTKIPENLAIDPTLLMQMRHENIKKSSKKPANNGTMINGKDNHMEKIHQNTSLEMKYLNSQLKKFKDDINFTKYKETQHNPFLERLELKSVDNSKIFKCLEQEFNSVQEFYLKNLNQTDEPNAIEEMATPRDEESDLLLDESWNNEQHVNDDRYVRFRSVIEIIQYGKEEVNSSRDCSIIELDENGFSENEKNGFLEIKLTPKEVINNSEPVELIDAQIAHDIETSESSDLDLLNKTNDSIDQINYTDNPLIVSKINLDHLNHNIDINNKNCQIMNGAIENATEKNAIKLELFSIKSADKKQLNKYILQKYFLRWAHFMTLEKLSREKCNPCMTKVQKFETFLKEMNLGIMDKPQSHVEIEAKKIKNQIVLTKKYQNKIKIQQDIIELQKLKLERQEKMITELKLSKFSEDVKESKTLIKDELRKVARNGCQKLRSKAKCIQIAGNLKDNEDDEFAKLQTRGIPKFLIEMQQRAQERNDRHQEARIRREKMEKEREELRLAAEEAKRLEDEEIKRLRIEELREKRRQEKLIKIQKEKERLRYAENVKKAEQFYRHYLLTKFGIERFKILIRIKKYNQKKAQCFNKRMIVRNTFKKWLTIVNNTWDLRKEKARQCYRKQLLRMGITYWIRYHLILKSKMLVAIDWYEVHLSEKIMNLWNAYAVQQKMIIMTKTRQAISHYDWHLKWKVLDHWRRLQTILRIEKETEERRQRWRVKIWELLPDYTHS